MRRLEPVQTPANRISEIVSCVARALTMARRGAAAARDPSHRVGDHEELIQGVQTAVVWGRDSTFMLQNLDGKVRDWKEWWAPMQDELSSDKLNTFFNRLRSDILHGARVHVALGLKAPPMSALGDAVGPKPHPGASLVLEGLRGYYWNWMTEAGDSMQRDIPWPTALCGPKKTVFRSNGTAKLPQEHWDTDVADLCDRYLDTIESVVARTIDHYFPPGSDASVVA